MVYPEYLEVFSDNGEIDVEVKFKGFSSAVSITKAKMFSEELAKLIDRSTGSFYTAMRFDDHLLDIEAYQIDPIKNKLTIVARKAS